MEAYSREEYDSVINSMHLDMSMRINIFISSDFTEKEKNILRNQRTKILNGITKLKSLL